LVRHAELRPSRPGRPSDGVRLHRQRERSGQAGADTTTRVDATRLDESKGDARESADGRRRKHRPARGRRRRPGAATHVQAHSSPTGRHLGAWTRSRDMGRVSALVRRPVPLPVSALVRRPVPESYLAARSVSFCTLQLLSSPTSSSFSLRQSMEFTRPNSFTCLPALPNLPTIFPSRSTL
jgi:hypothetical protein